MTCEIIRRTDALEAEGVPASEILNAIATALAAALDRYARPEDIAAYFSREAARASALIETARQNRSAHPQ